MLRFEYPLDLQMVTVAQGRRFSSANNDAAATRGTSQQEDHVFAAINGSAFPQPGRYTLQSNALMIEARRMGRDIQTLFCAASMMLICVSSATNVALTSDRMLPLVNRGAIRSIAAGPAWAPY